MVVHIWSRRWCRRLSSSLHPIFTDSGSRCISLGWAYSPFANFSNFTVLIRPWIDTGLLCKSNWVPERCSWPIFEIDWICVITPGAWLIGNYFWGIYCSSNRVFSLPFYKFLVGSSSVFWSNNRVIIAWVVRIDGIGCSRLKHRILLRSPGSHPETASTSTWSTLFGNLVCLIYCLKLMQPLFSNCHLTRAALVYQLFNFQDWSLSVHFQMLIIIFNFWNIIKPR
jgi:hypothetical protein